MVLGTIKCEFESHHRYVLNIKRRIAVIAIAATAMLGVAAVPAYADARSNCQAQSLCMYKDANGVGGYMFWYNFGSGCYNVDSDFNDVISSAANKTTHYVEFYNDANCPSNAWIAWGINPGGQINNFSGSGQNDEITSVKIY